MIAVVAGGLAEARVRETRPNGECGGVSYRVGSVKLTR